MQFFCKKMQKLLHMSKKSSIFVADLGIVPTTTIKYYRVMEKRCVFKCCINGKWYRVYECVHPADKFRTYYQTYAGRKRLDLFTWTRLGSAIGSILSVVEKRVLIDLVEVWK